jgi:hypothetical protein
MKKLTYLSLVGVMGLLMSCGGNGESQEPADMEPVVPTEGVEGDTVITPVETTEETAK